MTARSDVSIISKTTIWAEQSEDRAIQMAEILVEEIVAMKLKGWTAMDIAQELIDIQPRMSDFHGIRFPESAYAYDAIRDRCDKADAYARFLTQLVWNLPPGGPKAA